MNRIVLFALIVGAFMYSACTGNNEQNEQKKKQEAELRLFKEKIITLPENMLAKHCDEQILPDTTLLERPLKMIVYINQDGCTDCKLRGLLPYYMFILENEYLDNFGVVIILNTVDRELAESTLADMRFRRTVFYDLDNSFERLNPHLPQNEQFHTFLLNEENKVILVGAPVYNEKLKKLYLKEMKRGLNKEKK